MILLKALIIGFSIAMPVGPIGMLCIKNSLAHGFRIGLAVGLGAAFADCIFGFIAGGGLVFISQFLLDYAATIKLIGGTILLWLGAIEIKNAKKIPDKNLTIKSKKFYKTLVTTFFLTLTNPMTILSFIGVFAAIGGISAGKSDIAIIIAGVFLGSLAWWITLAGTTSIIRHKIPQSFMVGIKIISGLILIGFGTYSLVEPWF
jgi:threonine/homoserine/homoserine lactone efflux protein